METGTGSEDRPRGAGPGEAPTGDVNDMVRYRLVVKGRVQGVGFRFSCREQAERLGLVGRAMNLPDGTVEVVVEGRRGVAEELVAWCRHGPRHARVTSLDRISEPVQGDRTFTIA